MDILHTIYPLSHDPPWTFQTLHPPDREITGYSLQVPAAELGSPSIVTPIFTDGSDISWFIDWGDGLNLEEARGIQYQ